MASSDRRYEQRFNDTKIAVDAALIAADKAVAAALAGQKEAVTKAEVAAEKRFESVNEFRNTLADQQRSLMPRSEVDVLFKNVNEKIAGMVEVANKTEGKGIGESVLFAYIVGIAGIVLAIIGFVLKKWNFSKTTW